MRSSSHRAACARRAQPGPEPGAIIDGMSVWHLALAADWHRAMQRTTYDMSTRGATIADVGYLHASADRRQADAVARRFYADVTDPLVLLEIDETLLGPCALTIRFEPADPAQPSGAATELFPHIYGGLLPVDCVVSATPYVVARDSRT